MAGSRGSPIETSRSKSGSDLDEHAIVSAGDFQTELEKDVFEFPVIRQFRDRAVERHASRS